MRKRNRVKSGSSNWFFAFFEAVIEILGDVLETLGDLDFDDD